jgi:hypothetical protein
MKHFFVGLALALAVMPATSEAVVVTDAFLFSDWTTPVNASVPPYDFAPVDGVRLNLNGSGVTDTISDVGVEGPFVIDQALTHESNSGDVNAGEVGGTSGAHINSEIGILDDVGVVNFGPSDAALNLDFSAPGSSVILALPAEGALRLMIGEDAGVDPFKLELCNDAICSAPQTLFDGFDADSLAALDARADFSFCDNTNTECVIDQIYLFEFDTEAFGWVRISESGDPGAGNTQNFEALEIDFVGTAIPQNPPIVPEPASMLLFGLGSMGAIGFGGRKVRKS